MRRLALPLALMLAFALAAPVAAESKSATYKGPIASGTFYCGTTDATALTAAGETWKAPTVTGAWTLTLSNDRTATVTVHAWYDGAHHMSTGHGQYQVSPAGDRVTMTLTIGSTSWTATLDAATETFTWAADLSAFYQCPLPGNSTNPLFPKAYDNLVYTGTIDR